MSKIRGCIFGMAIGDGFGYPTEFLSVEEIQERWQPNGPQSPMGDPILVTDDTQMAIAVGRALLQSRRDDFAPSVLGKHLIENFIEWLNDPQNNRAPGMTCLTACERLERGLDWEKATALHSKGSGANMRVLPVGLLTRWGVPIDQIGAIAQFQSAITHGHPTALAAADLTAITIVKILNGTPAHFLLDQLEEYVHAQLGNYHGPYLLEIWDRPPFRTSADFINFGWEELSKMLLRVRQGIQEKNKEIDPCLVTGAGWTAEESFATALYCFLLYPDDPIQALRRAVFTSGDSDSIACLTGGFSGAYCGTEHLPKDWMDRIEYKSTLSQIVEAFE
ncbi:ADP-ribosylglycohydrolase family protein [Pontibacter sp. G13]|uniref:ADP-ribosylglycohydrolase family protein n=1 Tax=Pontibacter sp. G13 TaxID=3074898 RepID=UPI00288B2B46|nr:ADP-ribosylglycohydrolase family protein [Pontibacter sp. G13]WNJ17872.1 ADP-ribosylglycohydrolase family protein [Pontibacter sp. G13]